jgi:ubiquinone/menaquinone biosynthesis C-methylase UbiE
VSGDAGHVQDDLRRQWEENAEFFASLIGNRGTPHHRKILNPCVDSLLGELSGKRLLDAGCGEGYLSRYFAERGARVTGVDFSERLIRNAEKLTSDVSVDYRVGDICELSALHEQSFDAVLCNLVILNVPCAQDAISEFYRVLDRGGILVMSIVHPAFDFYGPGEWEMGERNEDTGRREGLCFKMDNYFEEQTYERYWRSREGERFPEPITFFHRTISSYFDFLTTAGFEVTKLEEPVPVDKDPFFDRERRIPFFMVFKAVKSEE